MIREREGTGRAKSPGTEAPTLSAGYSHLVGGGHLLQILQPRTQPRLNPLSGAGIEAAAVFEAPQVTETCRESGNHHPGILLLELRSSDQHHQHHLGLVEMHTY